MRIILTRHGETEENKQGIMQGHIQGTLSDLGKEQARKLALRLKDEKIDFIYSSDLARAADTAREIAKYHPSVPLKFTEEMRERDMGEFEGKKKSDMGFDPTKLIGIALEIKDGEALKDLYDRAARFVDFLKRKHADQTVLLVGHNAINVAVISVLTKKECNDMKTVKKMKNASVSIFESRKDGCFDVIEESSTDHLD